MKLRYDKGTWCNYGGEEGEPDDYRICIRDETDEVVAHANGETIESATAMAERITRAVNCHDELVSSLKALTASEYAGHNGACVYCRRTSTRGHADDCAFVAAKALIDSMEK